MNSRERVCKAIHSDRPDRIPVRHSAMPAALHEHGRKLLDLWRQMPGDFGENCDTPISHPDPRHIQPDGSYLRRETDGWGVEWEFIQYGIAGHPRTRPLDDLAKLKDYRPPVAPVASGQQFEADRQAMQQSKERCYALVGWINLFEIMHAVRNFEDVLMDLYDDTAEINRLADLIVEYQLGMVRYHLATGADGIMLADDWGTQTALLLGPEVWRRFFRPRYRRLIEPIKQAGRDVFYHSCGHILPLVNDIADLGVDVFWPQLSSNDNTRLAALCRERRMALELHMDRQQLMTFGTPAQIDTAVALARRTFGTHDGGIIYHAEIDNGFPFENVEALLRAFHRYG